MENEDGKVKIKSLREHPIIFFDGVCGMCNGFVDLILRVDKKGIFRFAPLQGETAKSMLGHVPEDALEWSMIYLDEHDIYDQSDASLEVYKRLGGAWRILSLIQFIPRASRNFLYRVLARNRYRWFGRRQSCRIPGEAEKNRFLP